MSAAGPIAQLLDRRHPDGGSPVMPGPARLTGVIVCGLGTDPSLGSRLAAATRDEDEIEICGSRAIARAPGLLTMRDLHRLADRIRAELEAGATLGLAVGPDGSEPWLSQALVDQAIVAFTHGERHGGGTVVFSDELAAEERRRDQLARDLAEAIEARRLVAHFQPIVDLLTGDISGVEVLARWSDPIRQLVRPAGFLDVAIEAGLLGAIGDQVLDNALARVVSWARGTGRIWPVTVNVHRCQLDGSMFAKRVQSLLAAHGVDPRCLELELNLGASPTTHLGEMGPVAMVGLEQLHRAGVGLAVEIGPMPTERDEASLDNRVTTVKLHRGLLDRCLEDPDLGRTLAARSSRIQAGGARVVAQGIETAEHHRVATELGVDLGQGFWIHRPVAAERLDDVMSRGARVDLENRNSR